MHKKIKVLPGDKYGMLTILKEVDSIKTKYGKIRVFLCRCSCGKEKNITLGNMRAGITRSCGCYAIKKYIERHTTHGMTKTRIFKIWQGMLKRCENKNCKAWKRYGGSGINVCKSWHKFENFYKDMMKGYDDVLTLDRIDNTKGYCKENCRWATKKQQSNNKSNNVNLTYCGETHNVAEWAQILGWCRYTIYQRVKNGWSVERIFTKVPGYYHSSIKKV